MGHSTEQHDHPGVFHDATLIVPSMSHRDSHQHSQAPGVAVVLLPECLPLVLSETT
jgi:hypothetical protein